MKNLFKISIIIFILSLSHAVFASTLSVVTNNQPVKTGGLFDVSIILNTDSNLINTIEGDLIYDKNLTSVEKINIGNSFISMWVEKPSLSTNGMLHFSGIVPGGVNLQKGEVFTVTMRANKIGDTKLSIDNANLYVNDGIGSKDQTKIEDSIIKIVQGQNGVSEIVSSNDVISPENFKIVRTRSPYAFDNQYFVIFSTQDKGTGVDHYSVCEYTKNDCVKSDSPYLLKNQNAFYRVIVTAYDAEGNSKEVILTSPWLVLVVIIFVAVILVTVLRFRHRYLRKNRV